MSLSQRRSAILSAFSAKAKANEIVAVRGVTSLTKTNEAGDFLKKVTGETKAKRFTFILSDKALPIFRFLRNLGNVKSVLYKNASAFDIIGAGQIVMDEDIFEKKVVKAEKTAKVAKVAKVTKAKTVKKAK